MARPLLDVFFVDQPQFSYLGLGEETQLSSGCGRVGNSTPIPLIALRAEVIATCVWWVGNQDPEGHTWCSKG